MTNYQILRVLYVQTLDAYWTSIVSSTRHNEQTIGLCTILIQNLLQTDNISLRYGASKFIDIVKISARANFLRTKRAHLSSNRANILYVISSSMC